MAVGTFFKIAQICFEHMIEQWKVKTSRYILDRWWLKVREDHVVLPSGKEMPEFHVLEYPDWTMMLGQNEKGDLVLVEQYRHGLGRLSLEFPSGMLEKGEHPETGARREFEEETGYLCGEVRDIGRLVEDPSRHNNTAHAFFCGSATQSGIQQLDETENLQIVCMSVADVREAIESERMVHGLHIGTFYRALYQGLISP